MMNINIDCLIKRTIILPILFLVFLSSKAQSYVCTIEGSTTDTETTKIYLVESGADIRTSSGVITIPVENGRFNYVLKGKEKQYYQLIADNHYHQGCIRAAYIIAENQHVVVTMGRAEGDQVTVKGNGKETRMLQRCIRSQDSCYGSETRLLRVIIKASYREFKSFGERKFPKRPSNASQQDSLDCCISAKRQRI